MPRFFNQNNFPFPGMNQNVMPNMNENMDMNNFAGANPTMNPNLGCGCNQGNPMPMPNPGCGCHRPKCPTIFKECPPIVTCSKQVIDQYHITKQPYIHNFHTEVVHHHILQNEFIPNYTCSEVHVNDGNNQLPPRL